MKHWHCPNCHAERDTESNIVIAFCKCGDFLQEVKVKRIKQEVGEDGRR